MGYRPLRPGVAAPCRAAQYRWLAGLLPAGCKYRPAWMDKHNTMTDGIDFDALTALGLSPAMRQQLACGLANPQDRTMRLVAVQRDHLLLHDGRDTHRAQCGSTLQLDLQAQDETLAVGDWVLAQPRCADGGGGDDDWRITCRLLPQQQISRRVVCNTGGSRGGFQRQALVSNVDAALLLMGLDADFNLRRLERYLALVQLAGMDAVLVLSKADTVPADVVDQRLAQARQVLPASSSALALDVRQPAAAAALTPWLGLGRTLVLLGSSGAGKSSLSNTLLQAFSARQVAGDRLATGAVRAGDSRGRHTTTVRSLLPLPGGACVIDTPGLRALRLEVDDADHLADAFGDVARWAPLCRFRNCQHGQEPGCAVRAAVDAHRLNNYHKLLREAGRDALTVQQRQAQVAQWKARGRDAQLRIRAKREAGG